MRRFGYALFFAVLFSSFFVPVADAAPHPPNVERWRWLVEGYEWDADLALAVIDCESDGDPGATNPYSGAAGLFQLYGWGWKARQLFGPMASVYTPWVNAEVAHWIWRADGRRFGGRAGWQASIGCWG